MEDQEASPDVAGPHTAPIGRVSFDDLSPTEFEEFCFDLFKRAGYVNVDWRKGTPLAASPADQGRDVEAVLERTDLDGHRHGEKWNIDAKHYSKGVPAEALESLITWSTATRPAVALVVVSGFLTNQAKNWLASYVESTRPPFRVRYWERPTLQGLIARFPDLLDRHAINVEPFRPRSEVERVRREYEDIVWYERIQSSLDWVGDPITEITPRTQQRLDAIEQRYDRERLYPWSNAPAGFSIGRLSALQWVMGEEWDGNVNALQGDGDEND